MRIPINVPELGTKDEPVRLNSWFIDEGDWIVEGELLVELLLSGITFDVAAAVTGRLIEIARPVDALLSPGETLGWIDCPSVESTESV